ncbi:TRAP transporter small permease [Marinovum sp. SP66]|uniref:TRAP transporter small permease n=1 Tax=Marinovum TaxID=367771 RepID=UPI00237BC8C2|nr:MULTISPECIES: TRAP transporter small permease [unclassified Marinovum]MDD9740074.1 TRAP transporter small permease [Marinovum sp. SP66]MDD9742883.1 TRAP transporter small permease [Marinovum sp. PR37]
MNDTPELPQGLRAFERVFDAIVWICRVVAGVALVVMTVIFGWLVFGRYVLNDTPTWVEQYALLLVMLIAFLGAAVGVRENTHLSVVAFRTLVPARVRTLFVIFSDLFMAVFGALMLWYGALLTQFKWNSLIPLIQISEGYRSLPLTVAGGLILVFSLGHLTRVFLGRDTRIDHIE